MPEKYTCCCDLGHFADEKLAPRHKLIKVTTKSEVGHSPRVQRRPQSLWMADAEV